MDPKAFLGHGWAHPVRHDAARGDLALAGHEDDVRQAVLLILQTGRGERVMRPDFGAGLQDFAFEPINTTTLALLRQRVEESLVRWEPRIHVREVRVQPHGALPGCVEITVGYEVRASNTFYNLVYPFHLQEGREPAA